MEVKSKRKWLTASAIAFFAISACLMYRAVKQAAPDSPQTTAAPTSPGYSGKLRFLALGDSYTIGEQVSPTDRWPMQLARKARVAGVDLSDPIIIARTGWTTGNLLNALDQVKPENNYDLVMLLIGVNNQFQNRRPDEYRQQFAELLKRSIYAANGNAEHVLILSIPDWGVMPFATGSDRQAIGSQIDAFNRIAIEESENAHVKYLDITPLSRQACTQPALIANDGLHPSAAQYATWADLAAPEIYRLFDVLRSR